MKEIIIHSGMPKTGSSALQVFFAKNSDKLKDESIDYFNIGDIDSAKRGEISSGNAALLARSLLNPGHEAFFDDSDGNVWKQLINSILSSQCNIGLLSSEFFTNIPITGLKKFKDNLRVHGIGIKSVFYVRRQDQFLMSAYIQRVKRHNYTKLPEDFIKDQYKKIGFLNYFGFTNELAQVLGANNVIPRVYENSRTNNSGIAGDFLEAVLGMVPNWVRTSNTINVSPSPMEVKLMIMMNKYAPRYSFSDFLVEDSVTSGRSLAYQNHSIIHPDLVKEVLQYFSVQNSKFFNTFLKDSSFNHEISNDYINLDELELSTEQVMDVMSGFLVRFDKRLANLENKLN